jgi:hypothetical protein
MTIWEYVRTYSKTPFLCPTKVDIEVPDVMMCLIRVVNSASNARSKKLLLVLILCSEHMMNVILILKQSLRGWKILCMLFCGHVCWWIHSMGKEEGMFYKL